MKYVDSALCAFFFGYEFIRFVTALNVITPHYLYLIMENIQHNSGVCVSHQKTLKKNMERVLCCILLYLLFYILEITCCKT